MSWTVAVNIGESFAEISARSGDRLLSQRSFLAQTTIPSFLENFIKAHNIKEISRFLLSPQIAKQVVEKQIGSPMALLVTAGFEGWLPVSRKIQPQHLCLNAARVRSPVPADFIFGIHERANSSGQVEKTVDLEELEFLASKLELSRLDHVAIGLLHSQKNNSNEQTLIRYFKEKGFKVFSSQGPLESEQPQPTELQRWWQSVINAYVAPLHDECLQQIRSTLDSFELSDVEIELIGNQGEVLSAETPALDSFFGQHAGLTKIHGAKKDLLYLGVEEFFMLGQEEAKTEWNSPWGPVYLPHSPKTELKIQPLSLLQKSYFGQSHFSSEKMNYVPGPMCFGKSLRPCFVDLIWNQEEIAAVDGFSPLVVADEKATKVKARLHEIIATESKEARSHENFHPTEASQWLWTTSLEILALQIQLCCRSQNVELCGPLSPFLFKSIKPFLKNINLSLNDQSDFILTESMTRLIQ